MSVKKRFQHIMRATPEVDTIDALELAMLISGESERAGKPEGTFIEPDSYVAGSVAQLMDQPFGLCTARNLEMEHYARPMFDMQEFCFGWLPRTQEWLEAATFTA